MQFYCSLSRNSFQSNSVEFRKTKSVMMRMARKELDLRTEEVTMIGDTMETDILGGLQMGYRTILVYSGSTQPQDLTDFPYAPSLAIPSLKDLIAEL